MDLSLLTPDQIASLRAQLGIGSTGGRVTDTDPPRPRQLHDLRLAPRADDPRPLFIPSAEPPRDGIDRTKISEFPKLMFHRDTGKEITVKDAAEQRQYSDIYDLVAKAGVVLEPMDALKLELGSFSQEDLELIIDAQQKARREAVQAKLAGLPEDTLVRMLAEIESADDPKVAKSNKSA